MLIALTAASKSDMNFRDYVLCYYTSKSIIVLSETDNYSKIIKNRQHNGLTAFNDYVVSY